MAKTLIDRKFMSSFDFAGCKEFVVEPNYILTPYAKDMLMDHQIAIVYTEKHCKQTPSKRLPTDAVLMENLQERIVKMLLLDFDISPDKIPDIVRKVLLRV